MPKYILLSLFLSVCVCIGLTTTAQAQNVQGFHFSSFNAKYYINKSNDNKPLFRVVEEITAEFPQINQNKGIVRAIPHSYRGKSLEIERLSLKRNGEPEPIYASYNSGPFTVIETGTDEYLQGTQIYELIYTMGHAIQDTDAGQEFFWDINGTGWLQRFDNVQATVFLDESLIDAFTGASTCFQGEPGSLEPCEQSRKNQSTIGFESTRPLQPGETLSIALSFSPQTFAAYTKSFGDIFRSTIILFTGILCCIGIGSLMYIKMRYKNAPGKGVIVPEYIAPKEMSVFFSAFMLGSKEQQRAFSAQILQLAVQKHIRITTVEEKRFFNTNISYSAELLNSNTRHSEATVILQAMFDMKKPHQPFSFSESNTSLAQSLHKLRKSTINATISHGYRKAIDVAWVPFASTILGTIGGMYVLFQLYTLDAVLNFSNVAVLFLLGNAFALIASLITIGINPRPLTTKGRAIRDYLDGLKMYMKLAESERLSYLQSPQGASKKNSSQTSDTQVLKLYENLLPYAVLFDLEEEWSRVLGSYYEKVKTTPSWYAGAANFSGGQLSSAVQSISTSAARSSGGSGFSGSSGAGGGGGGGGGGGR